MRVVAVRSLGCGKPANEVLTWTVPVDREHGRSRARAIVRDQQVRRHRHVALGVEHDRLPAVSLAVLGPRGPRVSSRTRSGVLPEQLGQPLAAPFAPRR